MTTEVQSILETLEEVSTELRSPDPQPVDWRVICQREDRRIIKGAVVALLIEIALCLGGYLLLRGWRLL